MDGFFVMLLKRGTAVGVRNADWAGFASAWAI